MTEYIHDGTPKGQERQGLSQRIEDTVVFAAVVALALASLWLTAHSAFAFDEGTLWFL